MKFSKLELALLNNCVQMRSVEKLYQEVQQQQCKICVDAELPVPEMKNFVYENLLAEHTKRIMAVAVFRDGRKYLYGEEVDRERYVKLFNAHLEAIGYEYFDACGLRIGTKGKILKSGEYACTVSYNVGQGPYRDFAKLHQEYLTTMGEDVSRRSYGDDAMISIREVRFFVYEEGSVAF